MSQLSLTLAAPILVPYMAAHYKAFEAFVSSQFDRDVSVTMLGEFVGGSSLKLSLLPGPEDHPWFSEHWTRASSSREYALMVASCEVDGASLGIERALGNLSDETPPNLYYLRRSLIMEDVEKNVHHLLLAFSISSPGLLTITDGMSFVDGVRFESIRGVYAEHLYHAVEAAKERKWPEIVELDVRKIWHWLAKVPGIEAGVGTGSLGRALAALTHILRHKATDSGSLQLVWSVLGLEALYAKGNTGLCAQLVGKTEALLGPRLQHKKEFGRMYDFRSRFIHGDIDIPFSYIDAEPDFERFHSDLFGSEDIALATLLATLQKMATMDLYSLDFSYAVGGA